MPVSSPTGGLSQPRSTTRPKPVRRSAKPARAPATRSGRKPGPKKPSAPGGPKPAPKKTPETPNGHRVRDLADPKPATDDRGKVKNTRQPGQVLKGGISPLDVQQGALGDCYFCAGLASVAQAKPDVLKNGITDRGDGTYDVRLYDDQGQPKTVTVDDELYRKGNGGPRYARGTDPRELWPALYEKAYAQLHGGYQDIWGGRAGLAMQTLTGKPSDRVANAGLTPDALWTRVNDAVAQQRPIAAATFGNEKKYQNNGLVGGHAYSILGTQEVDKNRYVVLRNPWAATEYSDGYQTDVDFDRDGKTDGNDGVFRMRLEDFQRQFENTDVNDIPPKPGLMDRFLGLFGG